MSCQAGKTIAKQKLNSLKNAHADDKVADQKSKESESRGRFNPGGPTGMPHPHENGAGGQWGAFEFALKEADKRSHKIIVETGVARGKTKFFFFTRHNWKDGMSTLIFSNYADYVGGHLYSCDIDQKNINNAKKVFKGEIFVPGVRLNNKKVHDQNMLFTTNIWILVIKKGRN